MTKSELRRAIRQRERELSTDELTRGGEEICARVLALPEFEGAACLFCFVGAGLEVDTTPILRAALAAGKRLCIPLCTAPGIMELREIESLDRLERGAFGIPAPSADSALVHPKEVELAILPCVSCSPTTGARLGRGGGYYDRFLAQYDGTSAALCREALLREDIPVEKPDRNVSMIVTEKTILRFE